MKESTVKNYEELPLFLSAKLVSEVLGVSPSSAYELMHEKDFPALSMIIGHISSATTLDIYSHVTDTMQLQAAARIDRQIGKTDVQVPPDEQPKHTDQSGFQPYKSKYRKSGTGCLHQINDHLWEGKYSPRGADGKRIRRNVYAKTKEECEEKLAKMIEEVKREIAEEKASKA